MSTSSASWQSGARVAVAVAGDAGLNDGPELSAGVPLGQWQWPWDNHWQAVRADACARGEQIAFRICNVYVSGRSVTHLCSLA